MASKWDVGLYEINDRLGVLDRQDIENIQQVVDDDSPAAELEESVKPKFPICTNIEPLEYLPHISTTVFATEGKQLPATPHQATEDHN